MNALGYRLNVTIGAILLIATIVISFAGYITGRASIEAQVRERLAATTRTAVARTEMYVAARVEELREMSTSALQVTRLSGEDRTQVLFDYANAFGSNRYAEIAIVDMRGHAVLASTGWPSYADHPDIVRAFRDATRPGVLDLTRFADRQQNLFVVYSPLFDENGRRYGTLVGRLTTMELSALIYNIPVDGWTSIALTHRGAILATAQGAHGPPVDGDAGALTASLPIRTYGIGLNVVGAVDPAGSLGPVNELALRTALVCIVVLVLAGIAMRLAVANAQARRAEVERRRLLEANQALLRHEARHDVLTGLPNRTYFQERLAATLGTARSRPDRVCAVLLLDLDEFKSVNDSLGHMAGDALLMVIADRMRGALSPDDFIARLGGDEFALLLENRRIIGELEDAARAVQDALVIPITIDGRVVYNSASIGIAVIDPAEEKPEEILRNADTAMYHAKALGRGRHAFFDDRMHHEAARRLALTSDLRAAIEGEQLSVEYQPIVRLDSHDITGFEALVRWKKPFGDVLPGEFIPLAEDVGLIVPIGRYVFVDACRRLAEWRRRAPHLDLRMHVNLSVQEVFEPGVDEFVTRNLRRFGLSPGNIVLEITESAVLRSNALSIGSLARLRATGVHLCIDDFGTGYSSLRYLHQLPFDALKIDRSFVESADGSLGSAPIVRMLVQLAQSYRIDVVAEGVETERQAEELIALDCKHAQGFHFHRPMGPDAIGVLLESRLSAAVS